MQFFLVLQFSTVIFTVDITLVFKWLKNILYGSSSFSDLLHIQDGLIRDPPYELRQKCFAVLGMCLETRRTKFTALAVSGIHKILKDDRFHSSAEPEDDSKWLPLQLLQATKSFLSLSDDTQVDILKVKNANQFLLVFRNICQQNNFLDTVGLMINIKFLSVRKFLT